MRLPRLTTPSGFILLRLGRPEEPHDHHGQLNGGGSPQRAANAHGAVRKDSASNGTQQQQNRRSGPAIALDVVQGKEVLVGEEVAVDAGEDDAGEGVVLEGAAGDGLAAALEGDEREGHQDGPVDGVLVVRGAAARKGDDAGGGDGQEGLGAEGDAQDPAALGREEAVEAREEEGADGEGEQGDARLVEAGARGRVDEGRETEADVDGVSCTDSSQVSDFVASPHTSAEARLDGDRARIGGCIALPMDGDHGERNVPVCMETKAPQTWVEELSSRPVTT